MGTPMDRSKRVFSSHTKDFNVIFPELEDAIVEWIEGPWGGSITEKGEKGEYEKKVSMKQYGGLFFCSNSLCENGGYEIDHIVRDMVDKGEKIKEDSVKCIGYESMPKKLIRMGHMRKSCYNHLYYRISLIYKNKKGNGS